MTEYSNPIVRQRADPWVYRHTDGWYYFTASVPEYDAVELRRSKTIQGLGTAETVTVWKKHDSGEMSCLIWAPELHYARGEWFMYFAAGHTDEVFDHRVYALTCGGGDPMTSQWRECGRIDTGWDSFALDATSFEYDGRLYFVWAQMEQGIPGHSNIYISEMSDPLTLKTKAVRLTRPVLDWECRGFLVNEGPAVLIKNGRIFITYSASATDRNYCMGLLWAKADSDLLDAASWHKSQTPVFTTSDEKRRFGPGHNSFTTAEDGKTDVLIYHARDYENIQGDPLYDHNRHTMAQEIRWDKNGMPVFE